MDASFPGCLRIRKSWEFRLINKMGCKIYAPHFILFKLPSSANSARLGITASSKVGNAVQRNRIKRLIREYFRKNIFSLDKLDYSVIVRRGVSQVSSKIIFDELHHIFTKK